MKRFVMSKETGLKRVINTNLMCSHVIGCVSKRLMSQCLNHNDSSLNWEFSVCIISQLGKFRNLHLAELALRTGSANMSCISNVKVSLLLFYSLVNEYINLHMSARIICHAQGISSGSK